MKFPDFTRGQWQSRRPTMACIMKLRIHRRDWIKSLSAALVAVPSEASAQQPAPKSDDLPLSRFEPRSALRVKETKIPRSRYPLIDFHTHITLPGPMDGGDKITFTAQPAELFPTMDHKNIRIMVNLTGGHGNGLREAIRVLQTPQPDRFLVFTEPTWSQGRVARVREVPGRPDRSPRTKMALVD